MSTKRKSGLSAEMNRFFREVVEDYAIDDVPSLKLLETACRAYDAMRSAERRIQKDGQLVDGPRGRRVEHPLHKVARDNRSQFHAILKTLGIDREPLNESPGRPPGK